MLLWDKPSLQESLSPVPVTGQDWQKDSVWHGLNMNGPVPFFWAVSCEGRLPHHTDFFFCMLPYKDIGETFQESKDNLVVQWLCIIKSVASEAPLGSLIFLLLFEDICVFSKTPLLKPSAVRKSEVNFHGNFSSQGSSGS